VSEVLTWAGQHEDLAVVLTIIVCYALVQIARALGGRRP